MQLQQAIEALCDSGVDFVIIGGVAAAFHGSSTITYDLDICYARSSENVRRLVAALSAFHPRPRGFPENLPFVWDEKMLANSTILTLQTDLGEIDLLAEVAGVGGYEDARIDCVLVEVFGRRVQALNLRRLIAAKRAAGRKRDLEAIAQLESLLDAGEQD